MNIQERVAALFNKYSAMLAEEAPVSLATAVLQGGQEIQTAAEEWAVGVDVFVVNDEGEQIPLPKLRQHPQKKPRRTRRR